MRLSFRQKLITIVGATAFAFLILICAEAFLTNRMAEQLTKIQKHYIPILEFGPRLESGFEHLRRSFQDSVAAQDKEALEKTAAIKDSFLNDLAAAKDVIDSAHISALREGTEAYYTAAYTVSHRLIAGDTGLTLVNEMSLMQIKQAQIENLLKASLALDRGNLAESFSAIAQTQGTSGRTLVFASLTGLFVVTLLSLWLGKSVLLSLSGLSNGLKRFGRGDFTQPIQITSHDELGDVAQEANQMAERIRGLLKELESFSYSVAHDLRAPLRGMMGFSTILLKDHGSILPAEAQDAVRRILASTKKMGELIDSLLNLSRLARVEIKKKPVNLSDLAQDVLSELMGTNPERKVTMNITKEIVVDGDTPLLRVVLTNLLGNSWKFTSKKTEAHIEFGMKYLSGGAVYFVKDNGAGFDMQYVGKLFGTFQRLHSTEEFEGTGIGLATVQSIINRHRGEIWAESKPEHGAIFYFTIAEKRELKRREKIYGAKLTIKQVTNRTVILVDDGIATGATMRAAIKAIRKMKPLKIVMAVPVAAKSVCTELSKLVNETFCSETPDPFFGVGIWYESFPQMTDKEVQEILKQSKNLRR